MANETKLSSIINPEVLANMIEGKLVNAMKFTPLCKVDNTLVGQPGNTVTSAQVADARLEVRGTGDIDRAQTTGWLSRFFLSWLTI